MLSGLESCSITNISLQSLISFGCWSSLPCLFFSLASIFSSVYFWIQHPQNFQLSQKYLSSVISQSYPKVDEGLDLMWLEMSFYEMACCSTCTTIHRMFSILDSQAACFLFLLPDATWVFQLWLVIGGWADNIAQCCLVGGYSCD